MKEKFNWKPALPHLIAILAAFLLIAIYFSPVMKGMQLKTNDVEMARGMQSEINHYKAEKGEIILWTNSMFGGMPAYQIWMKYPNNVLTYVMAKLQMRFFPMPLGNFFLYFIGFYIFLVIMKVRPEFAFIGGIAYAFTSYNLINIEAGHITKGLAMAFAPVVLAGLQLILNKKYLVGLFLSALALGLEIRANHLQITYYLFVLIFVLLIVEGIIAIKEKKLPDFVKAGAYMLAALIIAASINVTSFLVNRDYLSYSTRGTEDNVKENVANNTNTADKKGLDFDYAMAWSYGVGESFTLIVPNFRGGGSGASLTSNEKIQGIYKNIVAQETQKGTSRKDAEKSATMQISGLLYWGALGSTSGPIYIGVILFFLFLLGMFLVKEHIKWWILASSLLALFLSWGSHFEVLAKLFYNYFPLYNKFRVPMTWLLMLSITVTFMGALVIDKIWKKEYTREELQKALKYSLFGLGGLLLVFALFGRALFSFESEHDSALQSVIDVFIDERKRMFTADVFRSLILVLLVGGLVYLAVLEKIKFRLFAGLLLILVLIDYWGVDFRYFNKDDFQRKRRGTKTLVQERPVDRGINADPDPYYRVLDLTVNVWNDASVANYHKIIGGYHAAKMRRYQTMIEKHFNNELQALYQKLSKGEMLTPDLTPCLNMMNTKYFIVSPQQNGAIQNHYAAGNVWFAKNINFVENANAEIENMSKVNPVETVTINKHDKFYKGQFGSEKLQNDPGAAISLTSYHPEHMVYQSNASTKQLAVFSDIFYDKGWKAYIDNEEVAYFRANYILRALEVPAGEHKIEFIFDPDSYKKGERISLAGSSALVILLLLSLFYSFKPRNKVEAE